MKRVGGAVRGLRLRARLLVMAGLAFAVAGCPPLPPASGDFQILAGPIVTVDQPVDKDPVALNEAQLLEAPAFFIGGETVKYSDAFSTQGSQTEILVMARDPAEQLATLASIVGPGSIIAPAPSGLGFVAGSWPVNTVGPGDPIPTGAFPGVSLPDAYSIPYPVPFETPAQPSLFPLHLAYFTGSNGTLLAGNALFPLGAKGAYLLDRGVCSYDLDVQSAIFSQITSAVPNGIVDGIHSPCSGKGYSSLCDVLAGITISNVSAGVDLATFIDRNRIDSPYGGFVMLVNSTTDYRAFLNSASDSFNYTFTFDLSNPSSRGSGGILDVSYARNGEFDTGAFSQTIDGAEESNVPSSISDGVFSSALEKQAQPLPENITEFLNPKNKLPPECCGPSQPSYCYAPCANVPAAVPPPEGAYDDPSWYDVKYCGTSAPGAGGNDPADALLTIVSFEAGKQGMPTTAQNSLGATMTAKRADNPNEFQNVRCNFWPTYQTDHQCFPCISESGMCCPNGPPVPVCEVVARAKRVNVLPDKVELVWFDGPDLTKIGSAAFAPEYNNEALAIYLLLLAADANFSSSSCSTSFGPPVLPTQQLCQRQEEFNPFSRVFAHASGSASN